MSDFMQPEVERGDWWEVTTMEGETYYIPLGYDPRYAVPPGTKVSSALVLRDKWGARMSAPGYLDSTEWCVFESEEPAWEHLMDLHCQCPEGELEVPPEQMCVVCRNVPEHVFPLPTTPSAGGGSVP